jgi:segregation and condensation protein B
MRNGSGPGQGEGDPAVLGDGQDQAALPDGAGPDAALPDAAGPDGAGPDAALPDAAGPDGAGPDAAPTDAALPDGAGADAALPNAALPDAVLTDAVLTDGAGPGLRASLEAIMLVADEPVSVVVIAQVLERPRAEVAEALRGMADSYAAEERGFELREVAGGWRYYTREECAPVVERFVSDGQEVRLTQAALETLAVVAYRQPVSRARVSAVRGVNCDGVIRTLVLRGLVEEAGTDPETGAILFATTGYFLERLGLPSLDALPELAPFLPDNIDDETDPGHEPAES